jgi:protein gp37
VANDLQQATPEAARRLTDRIKVAVEGTWQLIQEAYLTRAWAALGYATWDDYMTREFGASRLSLPREERAETVASLRDAGLSLRAIAAAVGRDEKTVRNDLSAGAEFPAQKSAPDKPSVSNGNGQLGLDGKVYSRRPSPPPASPSPAPPPPRPQPTMLTLLDHTGKEYPYPKPQSKPTFNHSPSDGISWANWSWNPVTGCLHGCDYCYARAIINRYPDANPAGFTPLFHEERLGAPANTVIPERYRDDNHPACNLGDCEICAYRRVFVCSMADLYGRWVKGHWIDQVHAAMLDEPRWQYILLTKFPGRYPGLKLPPSAWVGTSVDEQKRVRIAEDAFRQLDDHVVKWLSLEPLKEPLEFTDLSVFDWVVIGAQTATVQPDGHVPAFDPPAEWVIRITAQAKEAGCQVHWKPNLRRSLWFNEYPGDA